MKLSPMSPSSIVKALQATAPTDSTTTTWAVAPFDSLGRLTHPTSSLRLGPRAGLIHFFLWADPGVRARLVKNGSAPYVAEPDQTLSKTMLITPLISPPPVS